MTADLGTTLPVSTEIPVRFRDLDGLGHVNNAVIATYLEIAREAYFRAIGLRLELADYGFLLARVEIDFRRPIPYGAIVIARLGCPRLGTKSWDFVYRLTAREGDVLWAEARTVQVAIETRSGRSRSIPDEVRQAIDRIEGRGPATTAAGGP